MKNFALIGAAGFIAPRHMKAIKDTGNKIVCALDKFDSVGIMDSYFPDADFFTEFERFDRHIEKLRLKDQPIDYVSVCSPNYLHDAHIRFGLRNNADVICEKPIVLNPWNIDSLMDIEKSSGKKVYNILQLRLHPAIVALKEKVAAADPSQVWDIELAYITARGHWYHSSWKGDVTKSGGVATNIGIHFYDMLCWIFGDIKQNTVHLHRPDCVAGFLELERARVKWFLSINLDDVPQIQREKGMRTYRSLTIGGEALEFSDGFTDLHTESYRRILSGEGFSMHEAKKALEIVYAIRTQEPVGIKGDYHSFASRFA
ncbi:MAG TPA: Gfo/Idh/MocA family oxidoreductase [Flavipsychrobacter sp.]|nr:Gfo/Idh/MocA family oxidoreductase [Flavipsychrobacter sp.]